MPTQKDNNKNKLNEDSYFQHEASVKKLDDFQGGTFEFEWLDDPKGVTIKRGSLVDDLTGYKQPQKYLFDSIQFTVNQAKKYLKDLGIDILKFKKAEKKVEDSDDEIDICLFLDENVNKNDKPEHKKAKNAVNRAISKGTIKKPSKCSKCGSSDKIEAHHNSGYDEENKFKVDFLCRKCHLAAHVLLNKKKKNTDEDETSLGDKLPSFYLDAFDETKLLLTTDVTKTPEGYLRTRAIVTNTGIFRYITQDSKLLRQLRDDEEVFKKESLETLKNIPITDGHPKELVNSENAKKYQVGFTGSDVQFYGSAVSVDLTITDKKMIEKIESGEKRAISCGYKAVLDTSVQGKFFFGNNPVDVKQKDIRYNHVAMVENGRAGDLAKIPINNMDSIDNIYSQVIPHKEANMDGNDKNNTTIIVDGVNYNVDKDIAKRIHVLDTSIVTKDEEIAKLQKNLTEAQAVSDALKNDVEKLTKEKEETKMSDAEINQKVSERIELVKIADHVKVKHEDSMSNKDIMSSIIKSKNETLDLNDKDDVYINAYFDSVKHSIVQEMETVNSDSNKAKIQGKYLNKDNQDSGLVSTKQKMHDDYKEKIIKESNEYKGAVSV